MIKTLLLWLLGFLIIFDLSIMIELWNSGTWLGFWTGIFLIPISYYLFKYLLKQILKIKTKKQL